MTGCHSVYLYDLHMQKLINTVQNYAWGNKQALTELYGIANPDNLPLAELWMGAHPKSSSQIRDKHGELHSLRAIIDADKPGMLGTAVARRFAELPFLFKVLSAEMPLSIQVHPDKAAAEAGYARENARHIPLDSPQRNYKDANHKPELVYALTPFLALNGFRPFVSIAQALLPLANTHPALNRFISAPGEHSLRDMFAFLMGMQGVYKAQLLRSLHTAMQTEQGNDWQAMRFISQYFPDDNALIAPLLLNVITLQPGEAMFLTAQTPHAYLHGVALEIMANSDNVLRAGLTPKHIDIDELISRVNFAAKPPETLLTQPQQYNNETHFPVPADDFAFSLHTISTQGCRIDQPGAAILFCLQGRVELDDGQQKLSLAPGESVFIAASDNAISACGTGQLARAYCCWS